MEGNPKPEKERLGRLVEHAWFDSSVESLGGLVFVYKIEIFEIEPGRYVPLVSRQEEVVVELAVSVRNQDGRSGERAHFRIWVEDEFMGGSGSEIKATSSAAALEEVIGAIRRKLR